MVEEFSDAVITFTKGRSEAVVTPVHVLYVVVRKYTSECASQGVDFAAIQRQLGPEGDAWSRPTIAPDAQTALDQLTTRTNAIAWAVANYPLLVKKIEAAAVNQTAVAKQAAAQSLPAAQSVEPSTARSVATIYAELDSLVGLQSVKQTVRQIVARQKASEVFVARGQPVVFSKHLVFTGAPGTGKTTVARLVAELYAAMQILPGFTFVEASRADLVGGFVGQTAIKVKEVVEKARGGVLFIDEAYALMPRHDSDYGHEALATLVQLMENYRDELVVIMAGYRDEMQQLIDVNPGLRSRMTTYIDFPDYAAAELLQIFDNLLQSYQVTLHPEARVHVTQRLAAIVSRGSFGNGRFVRSLWELSFTNMAHRDYADERFDAHELRELQVVDVDAAFDQLTRSLPPERKRIGF